MKFPRNARMFKGQLDFTPFAGVFFCLLLFVLLSSLVYTPGVRILLPETSEALPGVAGPTVRVALGAGGQLYFENQAFTDVGLRSRLREMVKDSPEPLTLIILADKDSKNGAVQALCDLGRAVGISNFLSARQSGPFDGSGARAPGP